MRAIGVASWYIASRYALHKDLGILNIKQQIEKFATAHKHRLLNHPNESVKNLNHKPQYRRLKQIKLTDLQK